MDDKELRIRHQIGEALAELAESLIRRVTPFDSIPILPELSFNLNKYYEYRAEADELLAEKYIKADVAR